MSRKNARVRRDELAREDLRRGQKKNRKCDKAPKCPPMCHSVCNCYFGTFARTPEANRGNSGLLVFPSGPTGRPVSHTGFMAVSTIDRSQLLQRGRALEYFTVGYNTVEGLVSIIAGLIAGSVSLVGFGLDSFIEVTSGTALLWRLNHDWNEARREAVERITLRIVGACFIALALYIAFDSGLTLAHHDKPERSIPGIVVAAVSLVVMPLLARAKRRVAEGIDSAAMKADSRQTDFCTYLSAILLGGLLLNALLGWWWADPVAGIVMVPIIAKEGVDAVGGKGCEKCGCG